MHVNPAFPWHNVQDAVILHKNTAGHSRVVKRRGRALDWPALLTIRDITIGTSIDKHLFLTSEENK